MIDNPFYTQDAQGTYELFDLGDFVLEEGPTLRGAQLAHRTYGELSEAKDNAILGRRPRRCARAHPGEDVRDADLRGHVLPAARLRCGGGADPRQRAARDRLGRGPSRAVRARALRTWNRSIAIWASCSPRNPEVRRAEPYAAGVQPELRADHARGRRLAVRSMMRATLSLHGAVDPRSPR